MRAPETAARGPDAVGSPGVALDAEERDLIRSLILADPSLVLGDEEVIRALIGEEAGHGRQVVDLRDRLVQRLEGRLDRLMRQNRSMVAAAYETIAGTRQVHRALLALLGTEGLGALLVCLTRDVPRILDIAEIRLCVEADVEETAPAEGLAPAHAERLAGRVLAMPAGTPEAYLALDGLSGEASSGGGAERDPPPRIVLREAGAEAELLFGPGHAVASEALFALDLDGAAGLLAFGAAEPDRFQPDQGTELIAFFGAAVERLLLERLHADAREG